MERQSNGMTLREAAEQVWKQSEIMPASLADLPELPALGARVWSAFMTLNRRRQSGGLGINPLTFAEIEAWTRLTAAELLPWEVRALTAIDDEFMRAVRIQNEEPGEAK